MDFSSLLNFARDSVGTYYDAAGLLQTAQPDEPRFDHDPVTLEPLGLLVEEERTNLFLNSSAPANQNITLSGDYYSVSLSGTGSVTVGAYGVATEAAPLVFLATAGSASLSLSGDIDYCQVEKGGFTTSYIPTSGITVTRKADIVTAKNVAPWLDNKEGTLYAEIKKASGSYLGNYATLSDGTSSNYIALKDRSVFYKETNYMPSPFDPSGWYGASDSDLSYTSVSEANPSGESFVGEFEYIGPASSQIAVSSYGTVEPIGTDYYFAILVHPEQASNKLTLFFQYLGGTEETINIEITTGSYTTTSGGGAVQSTRSTLTSYGYYEVEVHYKSLTNNGYRVFVYGSIPIGTKLKMQAAFFGKADDWPAVISDFDIKSGGAHKLTGSQGFTTETTGSAKIALAYNATTYAAAKDGEVLTGASSGVPTINSLAIGSDGADRNFNGHIVDVQYYPRKLSSAELINLTT